MINLSKIGTMLILLGILYIGYAILSRKKKSLYFHSVVINKNKEKEYLNIQLFISIINGILLILAGLIDFRLDLPAFYYTAIPVITHLNDFIAKLIAHRKGYLLDI